MIASSACDESFVDPSVQCTACDAVCCRMTVMLSPGDRVPPALVELDDFGIEVMGKNEEGWCIALDQRHMRCSIYELRPAACRDFEMGAESCRSERKAYATQYPAIPLILDAGDLDRRKEHSRPQGSLRRWVRPASNAARKTSQAHGTEAIGVARLVTGVCASQPGLPPRDIRLRRLTRGLSASGRRASQRPSIYRAREPEQ